MKDPNEERKSPDDIGKKEGLFDSPVFPNSKKEEKDECRKKFSKESKATYGL